MKSSQNQSRPVDDDRVLVAVKTPLMPRPTTAQLPSRLTVRQSVEQLQREVPKDAHAERVLQQLRREMAGVHHFLAVKPTGIERVDPERTTLEEIAVPREIRTHDNAVDVVRVAAIEVQSYAKVGHR